MPEVYAVSRMRREFDPESSGDKILSLSSSGEVILGVPFLPQRVPPCRRHGFGGSGHRTYQWRYGFRSAFPSSHLAADDVRCPGVWMDCAVLDQVSTQRATRSPSRRIFRNAESWREHSTEYCRVVLSPRLECEHKDADLVYAGCLTNAAQCPSVKLGCVYRLAGHKRHIQEWKAGRDHLDRQFGAANVGVQESERRRHTAHIFKLGAKFRDRLRHPGKIQLIASPFQAHGSGTDTQAEHDGSRRSCNATCMCERESRAHRGMTRHWHLSAGRKGSHPVIRR